MSSKPCSVCGEVKPTAGFQVRMASKDGRTAACKECLSARDKRRYTECSERKTYCKEAPKRYPESATKARRKYSEKHPDRTKANNAVNNAVRDGRLIKEPCECCGAENVHGHHEDYSRPLDVNWLCPPCHKWWHSVRCG